MKNFIFNLYHRSCYLCRLHIQNSSPSYLSEPPYKRGSGESFKKLFNMKCPIRIHILSFKEQRRA